MSPANFKESFSVVVLLLMGGISAAQAQRVASDAAAAAPGSGAARAVIERIAVELRDPNRYHVPLELKGTRAMTLRATTAGTVSSVQVKPGGAVPAQSELLRLDSQQLQLQFQRAGSELKIAQLEHDHAAAGIAKEVAALKLSIARNNLDIAQLQLDQAVVKAPYDANIFRVHVTAGDYVLPGTPLLDLADTTQLEVEVPVERGTVQVGDSFTLDVEARKVTGKVEAILPPPESFQPLRDLFVSVAAARIVIDNRDRSLHPKQAVLSKMVPRHPVAEVPNSALVNVPDGTRKVQVIRQGFVRDLPVDLLGAVGELHSFVSARFAAGDELIVRSSERLVDGTWLRPQLEILQESAATPSQSPPATRNVPSF